MKGGSESQVCIKKSVDKNFKGKQCSHLNGKRSGVALVNFLLQPNLFCFYLSGSGFTTLILNIFHLYCLLIVHKPDVAMGATLSQK